MLFLLVQLLDQVLLQLTLFCVPDEGFDPERDGCDEDVGTFFELLQLILHLADGFFVVTFDPCSCQFNFRFGFARLLLPVSLLSPAVIL